MRRFTRAVLRTTCFFTASSLIYTLLVALVVKTDTTVADAYLNVFGNLAVLFGFSAVYGASFLLFDIKSIPQSAKRMLHIAVLYFAMLGAFFLMADVSGDVRSRVLFVFASTFVFIVAYCVGMLIESFARKRKSSF